MTLLSGSPQPPNIGHAVAHLRSRWPWFAAFGELPEAPRWQVGVAGALTALLGILIVFGRLQNSHYVLGISLGST